MCGLLPLRRKGTQAFVTRKVPRTLIVYIKSNRFDSVCSVGVKEIAEALLMRISIPPNFATVLSITF